MSLGFWMAIGLVIGGGAGAALGSVIHSLGSAGGIGLGMCVGCAAGAMWHSYGGGKGNRQR